MANRRRRENQVYRVDCDPEPQRANPVVEEATGACGGGTAKRDLDGRSLCPLNPTPKVYNAVAGKGAVANVAAGKGSVPDKRKSFSGRRVQGAVVKSGKGRTGTVLKSGNNFAPAKGTTASKHSTTRGNSRISGKKPTRSIKF
ncbi:hypothetical protein MGG_02270 [Pyricularia oryzae 70-15]|uniref:Uncharacterized protein n=1 Tax=Pyricularia oryzae (strain 70-15 / ATCC MYA-4617 / FGSC 8958) TaxID=242507 RepID=G4MQ33_PYRO7|nr:uncharacterized protein MGG_02270 [Pyricularia oryzae 70-15]EHA56426.1 hypothetical protein MGG_02270 [Pyricularia oryzae 70-15]